MKFVEMYVGKRLLVIDHDYFHQLIYLEDVVVIFVHPHFCIVQSVQNPKIYELIYEKYYTQALGEHTNVKN